MGRASPGRVGARAARYGRCGRSTAPPFPAAPRDHSAPWGSRSAPRMTGAKRTAGCETTPQGAKRSEVMVALRAVRDADVGRRAGVRRGGLSASARASSASPQEGRRSGRERRGRCRARRRRAATTGGRRCCPRETLHPSSVQIAVGHQGSITGHAHLAAVGVPGNDQVDPVVGHRVDHPPVGARG